MPDLPTAAAVIAAARARGSNAADLRDAAHEACHALDAGLETGWDREAIHEALRRRHSVVVEFFQAEVLARAVEQVVCADLGVDPGMSVEAAAMLAMLEAIKRDSPYTEPSTMAKLVTATMNSTRARAMADRVIALATTPSPRRASRRRGAVPC